MKKLFVYLKGSRLQCVLAPLFKMFEAILELFVPLVVASIIDKGIGIEINCSGIRDGCGPFPQPEVLRLYRQLGGEIITVGSDAHEAVNAGAGVADAYAMMRDAGFRYVTVYEKRKPVMVSI